MTKRGQIPAALEARRTLIDTQRVGLSKKLMVVPRKATTVTDAKNAAILAHDVANISHNASFVYAGCDHIHRVTRTEQRYLRG